MMLRTTTQRGLLTSAAPLRTIPARLAAAPVPLLSTSQQAKVTVTSTQPPLPLPSATVRSISTSQSRAQPTTKYTASPLTDGEYHKLSNTAIDSLTETFETLLEQADVETLEQEARAKHQGATRGSPASEWDIECAVSFQTMLQASAHPIRRDSHTYDQHPDTDIFALLNRRSPAC